MVVVVVLVMANVNMIAQSISRAILMVIDRIIDFATIEPQKKLPCPAVSLSATSPGVLRELNLLSGTQQHWRHAGNFEHAILHDFREQLVSW